MNSPGTECCRQAAASDTQERLSQLEARVESLARGSGRPSGLTIIAFSGDMDKLQAGLTLATGAAAMGMPVAMFFTFWALGALKRKTVFRGKPFAAKLMTAMLPGGPHRLAPSKWGMFGLGRRFFEAMMRRHRVENLAGLLALSRELNVRIVACETTMALMAITRDELIEGVSTGGVATCLDEAMDGAATLFI